MSRTPVPRSPARPSRWLPYRAAFAARVATLLQYRGAALSGVVTQCWWGGVKVAILSAFYASGTGTGTAPALGLSQAISYTWLAQALFALLPWTADPELVQAVKSGSVAYDRLRPVDAHAFWYARSAGWLVARTLPRALLLGTLAGLLLPALGLGRWACQPPASALAALALVPSLGLAVLLSAAVQTVLNAGVLVFLDERGVNALAVSVVVVLSGSLLPLDLYPEPLRPWLLLQPLAGALDIPLRIYTGALAGSGALAGLGLQLLWTLALYALGRAISNASARRLALQGG